MMGLKTTEPKLYYSFSLDAAVPSDHISAGSHPALYLGFVRELEAVLQPDRDASVDPVVLFKLSLRLPVRHHERAKAVSGGGVASGLTLVPRL